MGSIENAQVWKWNLKVKLANYAIFLLNEINLKCFFSSKSHMDNKLQMLKIIAITTYVNSFLF